MEYNPDVFRDKTVLLPCDDPEWSNFTKYFAQNFESLGLKKLISTSYAIGSKQLSFDLEPTSWEIESPSYDKAKSRTHGKLYVLERDVTGDGRIDYNDLQWEYLEGDGDFRSEEVRKLRDEADIIVTNPPFSKFIDFFVWIMEAEKKFLIIGNHHAITYKDIFPFIMNNKVWLGTTCNGEDMVFAVPPGTPIAPKDKQKAEKLGYTGDYTRLGNACWYTNIEHGRRHEPIPLMTSPDIFRYCRHQQVRAQGKFLEYDNYDAIEVPFVEAIPSDYDGVMGVPVTFLDKYCPEQFEIVGATQRGCHDKFLDIKKYDDYLEMKQNGEPTGSKGSKTNENANLAINDGKRNYFLNPMTGHIVQSAYQRIFIRRVEK